LDRSQFPALHFFLALTAAQRFLWASAIRCLAAAESRLRRGAGFVVVVCPAGVDVVLLRAAQRFLAASEIRLLASADNRLRPVVAVPAVGAVPAKPRNIAIASCNLFSSRSSS